MTYRGDVEQTTEAGKISSYKTHDRDPILFNDGFVLSFRNGEIVEGCGDMGHCPNQFCRRNHSDGAPRNGNANDAGPGDVLLFDSLLPHGTPTNTTDKQRFALQYHYVPNDTEVLYGAPYLP